jgi:menaquinone-dependent protoporphyrinogen IX oxidase
MRIEVFHASKFGNGAMVAEELRRVMASKGAEVGVHHIRDIDPRKLPPADLYVFGSPARMGRPIGNMRRFVKKVALPKGTGYGIFATHPKPQPNKKTGQMPTEEEIAKYRRTIPYVDEVLQRKGLIKVADTQVFLDGLKGPLSPGWEVGVVNFADKLMAGK